MLLDTASSQVTNPETQQRLQSFSNTLTTVDNAVQAYDDGRFNDAIGLAANALGQPLSANAQTFVNTVQSRANTVESLVDAVKARDVETSTALLEELTGGKHNQVINLISKAGTAANAVQEIKKAVDNKDFSTAVGLASSLSQNLTGQVPPEQVTTVQNLVKAVQDGDVQASAVLLNDLTNGKHSTALNFIQTADSAGIKPKR